MSSISKSQAHLNEMERNLASDPGLSVAEGRIRGMSVVHKFGKNDSIGTSYEPVSIGGIYRTPQSSNATALRIKSGGNSNDTLAGTGARMIMLTGLDETGSYAEETIDTAGASASDPTVTTFMRLFRAFVVETGSYADQSTPSHLGSIVIESADGSDDWATIQDTDFARSQTEIGSYTVPAGKTGYVSSMIVSVDSNKVASVIFFQRQGIMKEAAPYDAMRVVVELGGVSGEEIFNPNIPLGGFPEGTDIGFMAKVSSARQRSKLILK